MNFAFEKSEICIENSIKRKTSNYFSIQFSIENHLPSKERRQARSDKWVLSGEFEHMSVRVNLTFEKSEICIENSIKRKTSKHFSIQFSIENHSKWQWVFSLERWAWIHVSSSEFDFWKKWNLYRELFLAQNFITLLDTIFYRKSLEVTALRRQVPR